MIFIYSQVLIVALIFCFQLLLIWYEWIKLILYELIKLNKAFSQDYNQESNA